MHILLTWIPTSNLTFIAPRKQWPHRKESKDEVFLLKVNRGCIWWNSPKCRQAHIFGNSYQLSYFSSPFTNYWTHLKHHISTNVHNKSLQVVLWSQGKYAYIMHVNSKLHMHDKESLCKEKSWQKHFIVKIIQNCTQGKHKKQQVCCSVMLRNSPKQNTIFSCLNWLFFYAISSISWLQMGCYCRLMKWHLIAFVRVSVAAS